MEAYKKENHVKNQTIVQFPNPTLAAIYLSIAPVISGEKFSVAEQVWACKNFIEKQGWLHSGDIFVKKNGTEYIDALVRARAWTRFDYLVSCISSSDPEIRVITWWGAKQYAMSKESLQLP